MAAVRFDDLQTLTDMVSEEWGAWSKQCVVTQEDITRFGEITHDMQWIHVDPDRAATESKLGTTIAHGFLILSLMPNLRKSAGPEIAGHGSALNYGIEGLRFLEPVPAGSTIHCRTRIEGVMAKSGGTSIDIKIAAHIVGHKRPCLSYTWKLLYLP